MTSPGGDGRRFGLSFEFFPPKTAAMAAKLWRSVERLAPLGPDFVSVTYGAGGSTRERTIAAVRDIRELAGLEVAGHLTCVGATRAETLEVADSYHRFGCRRIVALRGDPPQGAERFAPHPEGFGSAVDLVAALAPLDLHLTVSAYPEPHPESLSAAEDIELLKRKIDAGARDAITQFFFENEDFLRFRDACAAAGVAAPVHPGVLPVENFAKMRNFAARCGARVPDWMAETFAATDSPEKAEAAAAAIAVRQCEGLLAEGATHLHFYTLNNPDLPRRICAELGVVEAAGAASAGA
jgi:methylenetetrahydrofolate reductase (NADPH)